MTLACLKVQSILLRIVGRKSGGRQETIFWECSISKLDCLTELLVVVGMTILRSTYENRCDDSKRDVNTLRMPL